MRNFGNFCGIFSVPYQIPYAPYTHYAPYAHNAVKLRTPLLIIPKKSKPTLLVFDNSQNLFSYPWLTNVSKIVSYLSEFDTWPPGLFPSINPRDPLKRLLLPMDIGSLLMVA